MLRTVVKRNALYKRGNYGGLCDISGYYSSERRDYGFFLVSDIVSEQLIASIFGVEAGGIKFLATGLNASYYRRCNKKVAVSDKFHGAT